MRNFGIMTVAKICGERWPRLMNATCAAGYTGMAGSTALKRNRDFSALIRNIDGMEVIDREELDALISRKIAESKAAEDHEILSAALDAAGANDLAEEVRKND